MRFCTLLVGIAALVFCGIIQIETARADYGSTTFNSGEDRGSQFRQTGTASFSGQGSMWLEDRSKTEGTGIRLGNFELHPGFGAEFGYDSNVFYADKNLQDSMFLRAVPHLKLSTIGEKRSQQGEAGGGEGTPPSLAFTGTLSLAAYHFFQEQVQDSVAANASLNLFILPKRPVNFVVRENFSRSIRPFAQNPNSGSATNFARDTNEVGADMFLRSRSDVLDGNIGYTFGYDAFEADVFKYYNSYQHRVNANMSWRFFPYTALLFQNELEHQSYPNKDKSPTLVLSDNTRVRSLVGLNGAVTKRIAIIALAGFAAGFYDTNSEYNNAVGRIEGKVGITNTSSISLGYSRDYMRSFVGNFMQDDRVYFTSDVLINRQFYLRGDASLTFAKYGAMLDKNGTQIGTSRNREDKFLTIAGLAEYRISDIVGVNLSGRYIADFTDFDFTYITSTGAQPIVDPARYKKFEVIFGVRLFY